MWGPTSAFSASVDYYEITWSNIVIGDCCQDIVDAGDPTRVIRDPLTNQIVTVIGTYLNLPRTETNGFDFDFRYVARTNFGRFTPRLNATYVAKFEEDGVEFVGTHGGFNTYPRWKGYLSLDWDQGPWTVSGRVNYIHHYYQQLLPNRSLTRRTHASRPGRIRTKCRRTRRLIFLLVTTLRRT